MHDTDATEVFFNVEDLGDSADVVASGDVSEVAGFVLDPLGDLSLF